MDQISSIPEFLTIADWKTAFAYAGEGNDSPTIFGTPGVPMEPFGRADIKEIHAMVEGEYNGTPWLCFGELLDGRHFFLRAYLSGSDRLGGQTIVAGSRKELFDAVAMDDRHRLGL